MKNLTIIYIIALTIIALVIGLSQYIAQNAISTSKYDAGTIALAGRQTMLCQNIAKNALQLTNSITEIDFKKKQFELDSATDLWAQAHNALQYGDATMGLNNVNNSEKTLIYFLNLEPHYTQIKESVRNINNLSFDNKDSLQLTEAVASILSSESEYLRLMSLIVQDYNQESTERIEALSQTEYILLAIALILLLLEAFFIFRPAINQINAYTIKLEENEKSLTKAIEEQKIEKEKVEYLNKQAKSIFANINQGLFLINESFTISELHSKASEVIFDKKNLMDTNFIQLLRPKLVKRDIEALEMFGKHLFNKKIKESSLKELNPVENVLLYPEDARQSNLEPKYVSIEFSRISDENKIYNVLVSVSDQTQNVLMQKKISASEEKNKREASQLLSILKVDQVALGQFLDIAKSDLKNISDEYELDKKRNFKDLLVYTFNKIHNLKGNAQLIGLDLLVEKFHEIEDILSALRTEINLDGTRFIKVLVEVNDAILIIANMQKMQERIIDLSNSTDSKLKSSKTNASLLDQLSNALSRLSTDTKKPAAFKFEENGIQIPEKFKLPIKDIAIQLFRNSLIHGIEQPDEREKYNKNLEALIKITFTKTSEGQIQMIYEDDGRGLDLDLITETAIENGIITDRAAQRLTKDEKSALIFENALTTATTVDQYAGRGQGMSLIKGFVDQWEGKLMIESEKGQYFKLIIILPVQTTINELAINL